MRVLKWSVKTDGKSYLIGNGRPVYLNSQFSPDEVQVWTLEQDEPVTAARRARVVETGQIWPVWWEYLGSVIPRPDLVSKADPDAVWHVIGEVRGEAPDSGPTPPRPE